MFTSQNISLHAFNPLKWDCHLLKKIVLFAFNESPLKMMKNAFYLNFCVDFLAM